MTFLIQARHDGRIAWMRQGDDVSLEFEDGKGVSGRIAGVDIQPGGSEWCIQITHDGQLRAETHDVPNMDDYDEPVGLPEPDFIVPGAVLDARLETLAEAATGGVGCHRPTQLVTIPMDELAALTQELAQIKEHAGDLDISRVQEANRADTLMAAGQASERKVAELVQDLAEANARADRWQRECGEAGRALKRKHEEFEKLVIEREKMETKAEYWEDKYDKLREKLKDRGTGTISTKVTPTGARIVSGSGHVIGSTDPQSPHSRVAVFHESDGSLTIRVEKS